MAELKDGLPVLAFASQQAWEAWLEANHTTVKGIWLKIAKKDSGITSVDYAQALEGALRYGWIDGQRRPFDGEYFLQRFTPRGRRSKWSRINRDSASALIEQGRMKPNGLSEVEAAKQDGRWEAAYEGQRSATVPANLQQALDQNPEAKAFFETLTGVNRYAILYRLQDAKKPETRTRRLEQFMTMLTERRKLYP